MMSIVQIARATAGEAREKVATMSDADLRALLVAANGTQWAAYRELVRRGVIDAGECLHADARCAR